MVQGSLSFRRTITLFSAILASLSAGTNYAFSAYSTQLASRLALSSTALNVVGLAGNLGMYLSSPLVGRIIDRIGPTRPLLCAAVLVFSGYGLLWYIYNQAFQASALPLAALGTFLAGFGSSAALSSAVGGVTGSFDRSIRASVIGATLAGFGLSAFFWTGLGRGLADGDTAGLLALLSLGPALFMLIGAVGCQPVQPESSAGQPKNQYSRVEQGQRGRQGKDSGTAQLSRSPERKEVCGWALVREKDFWILWTMVGCCCGITLMVINNIGTIVETLYENTQPSEVRGEMKGYQASAVSVLSVFNCLGRVFAGTVSDTLQTRYGLERVWWLTWISSLFLISQIMSLGFIDNLSGVPFLSGLVGFAYGNIYGTAPALVLEWFGLNHFATNFGCLNLAPVIPSQIFNLSFGRIYDGNRSRSTDGKLLVCGDGRRCYQSAFEVTTGACLVALGLSIYLGVKSSKSRQEGVNRPTSSEDDESVPILTSTSAAMSF